ncbi:hypothetical protein RIF29_38448 [Crotalaria pallida]|uniref:Uncharacterized protein n=1 Tax=Crotalaria pallida TaxID=3830 RepID=A0AAN9E1R9_CROPI
MGKWDHRPRRFYRRQRSPPPIFYDINAPFPEFWQDGIPLWEKRYCKLIGVPWQKIVDSKKLTFCHSNVFSWNDSAAEEAFQNAKKRYWAEINNLPSECDTSPPHPDTYIHQIDWNPYIDPELIKEVDSAYFAVPDEEQENNLKNKRRKISVDGENPLEHTDTPCSGGLENKIQGGNPGNYHVGDSATVDNTDNPWENSIAHGNEGLTDNAWKDGHTKLWGSNVVCDHKNKCRDWDTGCSPWGDDWLRIPPQKDKGWGTFRDGSWCQQQPSNNWGNIDIPSECNYSQHNKNTGWQSSGANVSGWKQQKNAGVSSELQFRRNYGGRTASNQSFQRREGPNRHDFGYNGSHFRRDDRQTGHYWRRETSKKRGLAP